MVDKSKLGTRYTCFQCSLKFYDLCRPEPLCPKCGADQRENPNPDPREAILARFRGKGSAKAPLRDDLFDEDEDADEDVDIDEPDDLEDEEEEGGEGAEAGDEED